MKTYCCQKSTNNLQNKIVRRLLIAIVRTNQFQLLVFEKLICCILIIQILLTIFLFGSLFLMPLHYIGFSPAMSL